MKSPWTYKVKTRLPNFTTQPLNSIKVKHTSSFALALLLAVPASAALVNISSITYTGTAPAESGFNLGDPNNLINGSGLSAALTEANIDSVTHANPSFDAPGNAWSTNSPGGDFFAAPTGTVVFEIVFDEAYNLTNFYNWSYDFDEALNGNNIRTVTIDYGVGDFASTTGSVDLTPLPGSNVSSNTPLAITADRVRITVTDNFFGVGVAAGGDRVSAAEFAFLGVPVSDDPILTTPDEVTFTNNGATETIQVTLTNDGDTQTLNVTDARVSGTYATGFTILTDFTTPLAIAPGGTATIDIQLNPANLPTLGAATTDTFLEIDSNDTITPPTRSVPITGLVRDPWIETVPSVDLGNVLNSAGVQTFTIEVQNLGANPLSVVDGFFDDEFAFSVEDDLFGTPLVVPAGGTGIVNLSLDPTGLVGVVNDTLDLISDDPVTETQTISYSVTIVRDPEISVANSVDLAFAGFDPQTFSIPINNLGPASDLAISSATFIAGDTGNFSVTSFDTPVAATGTGNVNVSFTPGSLYGDYSATLQVQTNDSVDPTVELKVNVTIIPTNPNPVSPVAVDDSAANSFANAEFVADNLINGAFVQTLGDAPAATENWVTEGSGTDYFAAGTPPVLVFDMGADVDVQLLYLWAYSQGTDFGGDRQGNSARSFSLRFATAADGTGGFGTTVTLNPSFTALPALPTVAPFNAGAVDQPVQVFDLGTTVTARYVEMTLTDNFFGQPGNAGGDRVGINELAFEVVPPAGSAYDSWIANYPGLTGDDALPSADPDGDGINNEGEFGFDGNPDDGSDNGKVFVVIADGDDAADSTDELILTVAVRTGASFPASGTPLISGAIDGIVYQVEGSTDLSTFTTQVNLEDTAVGTAGLPAPNAGWEYRSFSLEGSNGLTGKGFLRAAVSVETP